MPRGQEFHCQPCKARVGETTPVAHGGNPHRSALPPQDRNGAFDP
ncbi:MULTISPECIES: hypothetical protein [unclassified Moorena]|nr:MULTISPECIES: hypothetical protein [unclassified Moorena]